MNFMKNYLILLLTLWFGLSTAQEKIEQEFRIDKALVPPAAQSFVKAFDVKRSVKWLKEIDAEGTSIEAKFKSKGKRYSIEFSLEGIIEDLEVVVRFPEVPITIKDLIKEYLENTFDYYKVEKIQEQYQATEARLLEWRRAAKESRTLKPQYEVVVKTRVSGEKSKRFELLFDQMGSLISKERVSVRSDNILRF